MKAEDISTLFKERNLTLGSAESFTGGLFASKIVSVPGASHFFKGSVVTYATEEKINVLGVEKEIVDKYGVVSKECASSMARHAKTLLNVDVAVSFTGNAGPEAMEDKPAGLVYIGVSYGEDKGNVHAYKIKGTRSQVRVKAVNKAYQLLAKILKENY